MSSIETLPPWAAVLVVVLVLVSALLALTGSIGILWLRTFYSRLHAPTLGTTLGLYCMVTATVVFFSLATGTLALKALLVGVFVTVTTPITLLLLARAALERDRAEDSPLVPRPRTEDD